MFRVLFALLFTLLLANPAFAIPSPELVIGSISSISQLFALISAMVGGGAAAVSLRSGMKNAATRKSNKRIFRLAMALLVVALASFGLNYYQYSSQANAEQARLQATLVRPAQSVGTRILDPKLKETSFLKQKSHPLGIDTASAAQLLEDMQKGARKDVLFIDVREGGENETGSLPGARHIRFPDIASAGIDFTGKKVVLLCHNGNRSSETCERLAKMGIDCRFIKGGIEKWIVEKRPFTNATVRSLSDLRALPAYPQHNTLLSTGQVKAMTSENPVQFVDVRYPGEFKLGHLPGAINIPLRATPTSELRQMIAQLPKKPIIAACYDRRGCFISQVLGLELTRAGHDFRGRYTLPWEYFVPPAPKPHIAKWLASSQQGLWQKAVGVLSNWLDWMAEKTTLVIAIFILALASRLLVLPISLKAERDQIITNATSDELKALKERLKHDPKRMGRAMQAFYRKHGLTPLRNLLALAFLPLMALGLSSVQMAATTNPDALLWFDNISKPGPYFILPVLFALLGCIYIQIAVAKNRRQVLIGWAIGFPLFTALAWMLSAAGGFYLVISISLLLLQRAFVTGQFSRIKHGWNKLIHQINNRRYRDGIIPLSCSELLTQCGNKSYRLSKLMAHGIAVPNGVVLHAQFLCQFILASAPLRALLLDRIWHTIGANEVAVRSSASAEDGEQQSFAGVFESHLNIERETLEQAILDVAASFTSMRASHYGSNDNFAGDGHVLVQRMVNADYAGVLFTRDPEAPGLMMVEVVEGTADALVSGMAVPEMFQYGRYSHSLVAKTRPPIDLAPLIAMAARTESLFDAPQDIEWTWRDGEFMIVQSRDITTLGAGSKKEQLRQQEWQRLLNRSKDGDPDEVLFRQDEMSEVLPRPTPLSLQLMQSLWANGGSVDHAARRLGLSYDAGEDSPSRLTTIFGRLYTDTRLAASSAVEINRALTLRLNKSGAKIANDFHDSFLPAFNAEMSLLESANFDKLSASELQQLLQTLWQDFVTGTHVEVEIINIVASYHITTATQKLEQAGCDAASLLAISADVGPAKALSDASRLPKDRQNAFLLQAMGHRAPFDYELAEPRYLEQPELLAGLVASPGVAENKSHIVEQTLPPEFEQMVHLARLYQQLKEEAKHQSLRHLAILRKLLMAVDRRYNLAGLCFYLTIGQILSLADSDINQMQAMARKRRKRNRQLLKTPPPTVSLSLSDLETGSSKTLTSADIVEGQLAGTRVAGSREIFGKAHVVSAKDAEQGNPLKGFEDGDIIVCIMVHPAWLPFVLRAGGVVCEVGGWLSHIAIVAREHDVAMIVGARGLATIPQDCPLYLDLDGRIEMLDETVQKSAAE